MKVDSSNLIECRKISYFFHRGQMCHLSLTNQENENTLIYTHCYIATKSNVIFCLMGHISDRVLTELRFSLNFAIFFLKCTRMHCLHVKIPQKLLWGWNPQTPLYQSLGGRQKTFRLQIALRFLSLGMPVLG